ncbi:hypothetical protein [Dapis sp. BLCC M229]
MSESVPPLSLENLNQYVKERTGEDAMGSTKSDRKTECEKLRN